MKNNTELRAALNMVLARLDANPKSPEEWQAIRVALEESYLYATKCKDMRIKLRERYGQ